MSQDPTTSTPSNQNAPAASDVVSLDDLDSLLTEADPGFAESVKDIANDRSLNDNAGVSPEALPDPLAETAKTWEDKYPKLARQLAPITKALQKLSFLLMPFRFLKPYLGKWRVYLASRMMLLRNFIIVSAQRLYAYVKNDLPKQLLAMWTEFREYIKYRNAQLQKFNRLPLTRRMLVYFSFLSLIASAGLLYSVFKGGILRHMRPGFLSDLTDFSDHVHAFDQNKDMVLFYRAFPQPEFTVLLNQFVVNLKPEPSHPNGMGFFQVYFNCDTQDTAIEVKDRERQILDATQRLFEQFTYSEVTSPLGEKRLKDFVRTEINKILNQGRIKDVYIHHKVTKP